VRESDRVEASRQVAAANGEVCGQDQQKMQDQQKIKTAASHRTPREVSSLAGIKRRGAHVARPGSVSSPLGIRLLLETE